MQIRAHSSYLFDISILIFWQHALLISLEIYAIQFDILHQVKDKLTIQFWLKSRRFVYNIFESQLSCIFSFVNVDGEKLVRNISSEKLLRSRLICNLCLRNYIKFFVDIVEFWTYIVYRHQNFDDTFRLTKVQRIVAFWHVYWANWSLREKRENFIMTKLKQAQRDEFS